MIPTGEGAINAVKLNVARELIQTNQSKTPSIWVNGIEISDGQIAAEMQYHPAATQREAMLKAAETLIIGELLRQRARDLGLPVSEDKVLASDDDFIDALFAAEVPIPEASDEECQRYYQARPQRFMSSPLLELRHILIASAPDDIEGRMAGKEKAAAILDALIAGESFSALARTESACPSKDVGGSLGQVSRGQTVPEFERQIFTAVPGLLSRPIESRYGFHLVFVERNIPGTQLPFSAVKETISSYLNEKVKTKAIAQYIHTLITASTIEGYDFAVSNSPLMQ